MFSFLLKCQEAPEAAAHPDFSLRRQSKESQVEPPAPVSLSRPGAHSQLWRGADGHHGFPPKSERSPEE